MKTLLGAAIIAALATPAYAQQVPTARVELVAGQVHVVRAAGPYKTVVIPLPDVADVEGITDHTIAIQARKEGNTSILLTDAEGRPVEQFNVRVVPEFMQGRKLITVRSGGTEKVMNYWCAAETGCNPDPNNETKGPDVILMPLPVGGGGNVSINNHNGGSGGIALPGLSPRRGEGSQ